MTVWQIPLGPDLTARVFAGDRVNAAQDSDWHWLGTGWNLRPLWGVIDHPRPGGGGPGRVAGRPVFVARRPGVVEVRLLGRPKEAHE